MQTRENRRWVKIAALAWVLTATLGAGKAQRTVEGFDLSREPTPADWRYFIKAPDAGREKLWAYHFKRGKRLKDWAWGWRLGWLRTCAESERPYCAGVLGEALFDKALVVRAEAATRLGRRHEGTGDARAVDLLAKAYGDPRNLRAGRPMFVQNRILFALHQIGGDAGRAAGRRLTAGSSREAKTYWARLEASL